MNNTFPIAINFTDPRDTTKSDEIAQAEIEIKNGFMDIYFTDSLSGMDKRITITKTIIMNLLKNERQ